MELVTPARPIPIECEICPWVPKTPPGGGTRSAAAAGSTQQTTNRLDADALQRADDEIGTRGPQLVLRMMTDEADRDTLHSARLRRLHAGHRVLDDDAPPRRLDEQDRR